MTPVTQKKRIAGAKNSPEYLWIFRISIGDKAEHLPKQGKAPRSKHY